MKFHQVARALGWFSVGLGLAELLAPRKVSRAIGAPRNDTVLRLLGTRELASGVGLLLRSERPAPWLWSRVAGDVMDLALLGRAFKNRRASRTRLWAATAALAGVAAVDVLASVRARKASEKGFETGAKPVHRSVAINKPAEELYRFWRNLENLPRIMANLKSVRTTGEKTSHWEAVGPMNSTVSWDAEITEDVPNQRIAWRSLPGSTVETSGVVSFETGPSGRGTVVQVHLQYRPPAGMLGATVAKLFGKAPEGQITNDLHRFRQLMETGEIATTHGQSAGREHSTSKRFDQVLPNMAAA